MPIGTGLQDLPPSILAADARRKKGQALADAYSRDAEERRKRGQALAGQFSRWSSDQEAAKKQAEGRELDAAADSVQDDWYDEPRQQLSDRDWLQRLGVTRPEKPPELRGENPMLGRDPTPGWGPMYGFSAGRTQVPDTRGIQDVIDYRGRMPGTPAPQPPQAPRGPQPMTASQQAARDNPMTVEMVDALQTGQPASRPPEQVAAMYDLGGPGGGAPAQAQYRDETNDEVMNRMWGIR